MPFGQNPKYNRQQNIKSAQIVGASFPGSASSENKVKQGKPKNIVKTADKASSIAPSEEFQVFWGSKVDSSWFEGRRPISPFIIFICFLVALNLYLCSNLLFSPGEIKEIFAGSQEEEVITSSKISSKISNLQTIEDEEMLLNKDK